MRFGAGKVVIQAAVPQRPVAALMGQSGSAIKVRPMPMMSALPDCRMSSAKLGSVILPIAITGMSTHFLTSAAYSTNDPGGKSL
jgi:hypothetical protein